MVCARLDYAVGALIFAELPGLLMEWQKTLEDWTVRESQQVLEWKAEGRAEGVVKARQGDLLRVLEALCGAQAPLDVAAAIQTNTDPAQLSRWLDVALTVKSYDAFKAALGL